MASKSRFLLCALGGILLCSVFVVLLQSYERGRIVSEKKITYLLNSIKSKEAGHFSEGSRLLAEELFNSSLCTVTSTTRDFMGYPLVYHLRCDKKEYSVLVGAKIGVYRN